MRWLDAGAVVGIELSQINVASFQQMWPKIAADVEALAEVSHGRLLAADIALAVLKNEMQLWIATGEVSSGLMLTEIVNHPRQRDAHIISATGHNADRWVALWPQFEEWARANRCAVAMARCRLGWKKLLTPLGFDQLSIVVEKRL